MIFYLLLSVSAALEIQKFDVPTWISISAPPKMVGEVRSLLDDGERKCPFDTELERLAQEESRIFEERRKIKKNHPMSEEKWVEFTASNSAWKKLESELRQVRSRIATAQQNFTKCKGQNSKEIVYSTPVYIFPDQNSRPIGKFEAYFLKENSKIRYRFLNSNGTKTDLEIDNPPNGNEQEYSPSGYSNYHTVLAKKGIDWYQLPADPFPEPVWIRFDSTWGPTPSLSTVTVGTLYSWKGITAHNSAIEIIKIEVGQITYRKVHYDRQLGKPMRKDAPLTAPASIFFDKNGHSLLARPPERPTL